MPYLKFKTEEENQAAHNLLQNLIQGEVEGLITYIRCKKGIVTYISEKKYITLFDQNKIDYELIPKEDIQCDYANWLRNQHPELKDL